MEAQSFHFGTMGKLIILITWMIIVLGETHGCIDEERQGLLALKAFLKSVSDDLEGWTESDCCGWEGIQCNLTSRRVIGLNMYSLVYADYSKSLFNLSLLYPFEELQTLNLSFTSFSGWFDDSPGYKSLERLRKLEILDLTDCHFNESIFHFLAAATSLKTLILYGNRMSGTFPMKELNNFRNLQLLDLSYNDFSGPIPGRELADMLKLEALGLSNNRFSGSLEKQGICSLENLRELDLSGNQLLGHLPPCLTGLTKLTVLDLSSNQLSGELPSFLNRLKCLEYLSLSDNSFKGLFSLHVIANLSKLEVFKLSSRSNQLQVDVNASLQLKFQLRVISLQHCNLKKVPSFLRHQKELRLVDLSNNRLSGVFPSWLLENIPQLEVLLLQNNSFNVLELPNLVHRLHVLDVSANDIGGPLPENMGSVLANLRHLNLSDNGFHDTMPSSFGEMKRIKVLDLSHNNLSGYLPRSFLMGCHSLKMLMLSHNRLGGQIFPESTNLTSLVVLNMDNNMFTGRVGAGILNSKDLSLLDMSNNSLTGAIPSWMANFSSLIALSISNNFLQGTVPVPLFNMPDLSLLDLSGNMLSGTLASGFNFSYFGVVLDLQDNDLTGALPTTLLENLAVLDVRNNKLSGSIPEFVNAQNITVLLLRGNNFTGPIPSKLCDLSNIKLLDLALNGINGSIPSCLNNLSFGLREVQVAILYDMGTELVPHNDLGKYQKSLRLPDEFSPNYFTSFNPKIQFAAKHRYDSFFGRSLDYMFGLDLSSNNLSGEIPEELGDLQKIRALNLSHNSLFGLIPDSFSNLTGLESLDLSFNHLYGPMPPELTKLYSLAVFNVSYNNLSGVIPRGGQFDTFEESSYFGNPFLRGAPTCGSCTTIDPEQSDGGEKDDEAAVDMMVFYHSLVATYVVVLMAFLVFLSFDSPHRRAWFGLIDAFIFSARRICS